MENREPVQREERLQELRLRLAQGPALLLDGAMGTELERRGIACDLPLWSAQALFDAPETVREIHRAYLAEGAEILTACTFRTQAYTLAKIDRGGDAREVTSLAVRLAQEAIAQRANDAGEEQGQRTIWIAGSCPPLEDCYRPDLVPDEHTLGRFHRDHISALDEAGVDFILIETMNTCREALAAIRAANQIGIPAMFSFCATREAKLLSGENLISSLGQVASENPLAVLVNCLPPHAAAACLAPLRETRIPFGVYPNFGPPEESGLQWQKEMSAEAFAECLCEWARAGASVLGGCCGTGPAHIRALAKEGIAGSGGISVRAPV